MAPIAQPKIFLIAISSLVVFVGEREVREIRRAFGGLLDRVVLVLAVVPLPNANALVVVRQALVDLTSVPGFREGRRVVGPDVDRHRVGRRPLPNLDRFYLLGVRRLDALILARAHLARVDD